MQIRPPELSGVRVTKAGKAAKAEDIAHLAEGGHLRRKFKRKEVLKLVPG